MALWMSLSLNLGIDVIAIVFSYIIYNIVSIIVNTIISDIASCIINTQ